MLGGRRRIYDAWIIRGQPLDTGWHVSATELVQINGDDPKENLVVIDWNPNAETHIGLAKLLDVYAYTWAYGDDVPLWNPVMFRMRSLLDENVENAERKRQRLNAGLPEPDSDEPNFVSFLYLAGEYRSWGWGAGPGGMNSAAFLDGAARDYFRSIF